MIKGKSNWDTEQTCQLWTQLQQMKSVRMY